MIEGRELSRDEIKGVWAIDRSEVIEAAYRLVDGALVLERVHYDLRGWPPGEDAKYTPILEACYDRGGWFYGLFEDDKPVGAAVLDNRFIGRNKDQLQLEFLHVGSSYRGQGLGRALFERAANEARKRGSRHLYISATPSEHTIGFYLLMGCRVTAEPDPELFALEPEDIHLECCLG